jgi:hypothetical protein
MIILFSKSIMQEPLLYRELNAEFISMAGFQDDDI